MNMTPAQAPMRTVRPKDLAATFSNPRNHLATQISNGSLIRLAHGYAMAIPDVHGPHWRPSLEEAAAGIGVSIFGPQQTILMGLSAARVHHVIPRALAHAIVAVPRQHRPIDLELGGTIQFVRRDVDALDARLEEFEVGRALVTTPEQTALDLTKRPRLGDAPAEAAAAVRNLLPTLDLSLLHELALAQRGLTAYQAIVGMR